VEPGASQQQQPLQSVHDANAGLGPQLHVGAPAAPPVPAAAPPVPPGPGAGSSLPQPDTPAATEDAPATTKT
jgi:hypothetical protein